jgi:hypothetical protein
MSITLGTESASGAQYICKIAGTNYIERYGGTNTWSPASNLALGDTILIQQSNPRGGKFAEVTFNVDTAVTATTFTGVWEYAAPRSDSSTNVNWYALTNVDDGTNGFTTSGTGLKLTFDLPQGNLDDTDWGSYCRPVYNLGGSSFYPLWYAWNIRFRITAISGVTNDGSVSSVKPLSMQINLSGSNTYTYEDVYLEDVAQGWGLVSKQGESQYTLNVGLKCVDTNTTFESKNEQIIFLNNYATHLTCPCNFGELINNESVNGSSFNFENNNSSFISLYIFNSNANVYDCIFKVVAVGQKRTQGYWGGGLAQGTNQDIQKCEFSNWRSFGFNNSSVVLKNVTYKQAQVEPLSCTAIDCTASQYGLAIRHGSSYKGRVHRLNMKKISSYEVNPYKPNSGWALSLIDAIHNSRTLDQNVYWTKPNGTPGSYYLNLKLNFIVSLDIILKDGVGNLIDGAVITVYDKGGAIVGNYISKNGYVGYDARVLTAVSSSLQFSGGLDGSSEIRNEIIIADGAGAGSRSVISSASTQDFFLAEEIITPAIGDTIITVPYITYGYCSPSSNTVNSYSIYTQNGPFKMEVKCPGYKTTIFNEEFQKQFKSVIVLDEENINSDQEGQL